MSFSNCLLFLVALVFLAKLQAATLPPDDSVGTEIYLYSKDGAITRIPLNDTKALTASNFEGSLKSVFITHGWTQSIKEKWTQDMIAEFLKMTEKINVFAVDWSKGAGLLNFNSPKNAQKVGATVARYVEFLEQFGSATRDRVHLVGHSLGGHVMGYAGENLNPKCARVTGLDPPDSSGTSAVGINPGSATFVDIISTDQSTKPGKGQVEFFPNADTRRQPGCSILTLSLLCDHLYAAYFFTESINSPCAFKAHHCSSLSNFKYNRCTANCTQGGCNDMGYHATPTVPGVFYLHTNSKSPYCI